MWTKAHFWLGHFQSEEDLHQYFAEHYDEDGELLSFAFATDQSLSFCDHDFLEYGFEPEGETLAVKFSGYSYSEDWLETLQERAHGLVDIQHINSIAFLWQEDVPEPISIRGEGYSWVYLGIC